MKKTKNSGTRELSLDLIRVIAVLCVISVHFFYNIGFYKQTISADNSQMILMIGMRTFFMVCVPLFIILTGYLMNEKELNLSYYKGITHTIGIYIIISIFCLIYKEKRGLQQVTAVYSLKEILNFSADNYSWYIEMYIGLFLLIPFLNLIYNHIHSKQSKQILLLTFFALSTLPSVCNVYGTKVIPVWWSGVWPLLYYFIGCYLKEYPLKLSWKVHLVLLGVVILISTGYNHQRFLGKTFTRQIYNDWYGWQNVLSATLLFSLLNKCKLEKAPAALKKMLYKLSQLSLAIYLSSWIMDQIFYLRLNAKVPAFEDRLPYFGIAVPAIFLGSVLIALAAELLYFVIAKAVRYFRA